MRSSSNQKLDDLTEDDLIEIVPGITEWNGIFFVTVISDNLSSKESIMILREKGFAVTDDAEKAMSTNEYVPTNKFAFKIAIFNGSNFGSNQRNLLFMKNLARSFELSRPSLEIARLLLEGISDDQMKAMHLWSIAVCHSPIRIDVRDYVTCVISRHNNNGSIDAIEMDSEASWPEDTGFAFLVSVALAGD